MKFAQAFLIGLYCALPLPAIAAPLHIVAFGDSATSGWLVPRDQAYPAQLQRMLRAKGYDATVWLGLLAPPGTPREIVAKLNTAITKILSTPEAKKLMASAGVDVATSSPEDFRKLMQSELDRWGKVVKETGATVN